MNESDLVPLIQRVKDKDNESITDLVDNIPIAKEDINFLDLSTATLDNVAWHDFIEYQYLLTPQYFAMVPDLPPVILTEEEIQIIEEVAQSVDEPAEIIDLIDFKETLKDKIYKKVRYDGLDKVVCSSNKLAIYHNEFWVEFISPEIKECAERPLPLFFWEWADALAHNDNVARKKAIEKVAEWIAKPLDDVEEVLGTLLEIYRNIKAAVPKDEPKVSWGWGFASVSGAGSQIESEFFSWIIKSLISFDDESEFYLNVLRGSMGEQLIIRWQKVGENAKNKWKDYLPQPVTPPDLPPIEPTIWPPILPVPDEEELEYSFDIYRPYSWNFGLRLVYRQEWRPLGNQRGEIVKTIPLGPKQTEKVSTKIVRKTKLTKKSEDLKSTETTTETADTTKDSSEVINEASNTFGWNVEAEASVNWNWGSAKISGGMKSETEEKSKETSNHLSETIQKTASKIRTETKVIVSLESESEFVTETATEIINPNEEIPITYVYSKLQRQYEILTSLAEIHNVVMIAEPIPKPWEINLKWVRKYDWIIAKVLIDDSFRGALNSISLEIGSGYAIGLDNMKNIMDSTLEKLGAIAGDRQAALSLSNVDVVREAQINYRESIKEYLEQMNQTQRLRNKQKRLIEHIRENILHYCRAIWSQEDPQQRILRYRKQDIRIPLEWTLNGNEIDVEDLTNGTMEEYEGEYSPIKESPCINIADLINPDGPIGYHGNYAIYYMKPEYSKTDICIMLHLLKAPYLYYPSVDAEPILLDPVLRKFYEDYSGVEPSSQEKYEMVDYIPELRLQYAIAKSMGVSLDDFISLDEYDVYFIEQYPEFLFRKEQSRRFVLDSNNLIIDIEPGTGTALEPFKLAHRKIDVLKALEEKEKMRLENERLRELLAQKEFDVRYWPDMDKVVVIDSNDSRMAPEVASKLASDKITRRRRKKKEELAEEVSEEELIAKEEEKGRRTSKRPRS